MEKQNFYISIWILHGYVCVRTMKKKKQKAKKFDLRQIHGNFCSSHWTQVNKKIDWNSRFSKHVTNHFMFFRVVVVVETGKITSCTKLRTLVHCIVLHWYILHVEKNQQNFTFRQRLCRERITTHSKRKKISEIININNYYYMWWRGIFRRPNFTPVLLFDSVNLVYGEMATTGNKSAVTCAPVVGEQKKPHHGTMIEE